MLIIPAEKMTVAQRVRKLRRDLDLSQAEFAARLNMSQNAVTRYEAGNRAPRAAIISLICRVYNVREEWLRYGTGEMFLPDDAADLDTLAVRFPKLGRETLELVRFLVTMPADKQAVLVDLIKSAAASMTAEEEVETEKSEEE